MRATAAALGATGIPDVQAADATPARAVVVRSEWDDMASVMAHRSERAAAIVRENASVRRAMLTTLAWIADFAKAKAIDPSLVMVGGFVSPDGAIVIQLQRREE